MSNSQLPLCIEPAMRKFILKDTSILHASISLSIISMPYMNKFWQTFKINPWIKLMKVLLRFKLWNFYLKSGFLNMFIVSYQTNIKNVYTMSSNIQLLYVKQANKNSEIKMYIYEINTFSLSLQLDWYKMIGLVLKKLKKWKKKHTHSQRACPLF